MFRPAAALIAGAALLVTAPGDSFAQRDCDRSCPGTMLDDDADALGRPALLRQDRAEIEERVNRYVIALDTLDADMYGEVFTEDALFDVTGTVYNGRAQIRGIVTGLQENSAYAQTVRAAENGEFVVGSMGRYEDVVVKRAGRWQIRERRLVSFVR